MRPAQLPAAVALLSSFTACGGHHHETASASPHGAHDSHASHGGDRVPHDHLTPAQYAAMLEDPGRAAWQMPDRLVEALQIRPGTLVADVGTGSGYFLPYLNRAVGPSGHVVAEDIDPDLLALVRDRVAREQLSRVDVRRGGPDDPSLEPGQYHLVLLVDTYHHVENRPVFLAHVARALDPRGGRFVVVDFREGELPVGPGPDHKIPRDVIEREVRDAGMTLLRTYDFLPYQFVLEFGPAGATPAR